MLLILQYNRLSQVWLYCGRGGKLNVVISKYFAFILSEDLVISMAQSIQGVNKLGSLAIMLEIEDWEACISYGLLESARIILAEKWVKQRTSGKAMEELRDILKQPAIMAIRSAEKMSRGCSRDSALNTADLPPSLSSISGSIPNMYKQSHIG